MSIASPAQRADVVHRALDQLGKPYVWGAEGPNSYDCSGSTLEAWDPYVNLPHNADSQLRYIKDGLIPGCKVVKAGVPILRHWPRFFLKPGDLVFYYGDWNVIGSVQHVAIFVGWTNSRRMIVNATGSGRMIEKITITAYAQPMAYAYMLH